MAQSRSNDEDSEDIDSTTPLLTDERKSENSSENHPNNDTAIDIPDNSFDEDSVETLRQEIEQLSAVEEHILSRVIDDPEMIACLRVAYVIKYLLGSAFFVTARLNTPEHYNPRLDSDPWGPLIMLFATALAIYTEVIIRTNSCLRFRVSHDCIYSISQLPDSAYAEANHIIGINLAQLSPKNAAEIVHDTIVEKKKEIKHFFATEATFFRATRKLKITAFEANAGPAQIVLKYLGALGPR